MGPECGPLGNELQDWGGAGGRVVIHQARQLVRVDPGANMDRARTASPCTARPGVRGEERLTMSPDPFLMVTHVWLSLLTMTL